MARNLSEDNVFDWMNMKSEIPASPYSEHPPKAAKVLGTYDTASYQDRTSPGIKGNVQYQQEVLRARKESRSWSIESSTDPVPKIEIGEDLDDNQDTTDKTDEEEEEEIIAVTEVDTENKEIFLVCYRMRHSFHIQCHGVLIGYKVKK